MEELNVGNNAISKTKRKTEYNALAQAMLESKNHGIEQYIDNLITLTKATKPIILKGAKDQASTVSNEPENTVRFNATSEIGDIFGAKAPKQVDLKHSIGNMSDEQIQESVDESIREIGSNGRIQHQIAGSQNTGAIITNTIACAESTVDVSVGEQGISTADN